MYISESFVDLTLHGLYYLMQIRILQLTKKNQRICIYKFRLEKYSEFGIRNKEQNIDK